MNKWRFALNRALAKHIRTIDKEGTCKLEDGLFDLGKWAHEQATKAEDGSFMGGYWSGYRDAVQAVTFNIFGGESVWKQLEKTIFAAPVLSLYEEDEDDEEEDE